MPSRSFLAFLKKNLHRDQSHRELKTCRILFSASARNNQPQRYFFFLLTKSGKKAKVKNTEG